VLKVCTSSCAQMRFFERLFFGDFSSGATEVRECGSPLTSRNEVMGTPKLVGCPAETGRGLSKRKPC
jgi:hypothetical protein